MLRRGRKRLRLGDSTVPAKRREPSRPNRVWPLDHEFDQTADLRHLKLLDAVEEVTWDALAIECRPRIDAGYTVTVLDQRVAERKTAPGFIRCDNGPELTANALRGWCRFSRTGGAYIEPGSPWQNPYRKLRLPDPRRAAGHRAVLLPRRGPSCDRGLAPRLQPLPATPSARTMTRAPSAPATAPTPRPSATTSHR